MRGLFNQILESDHVRGCLFLLPDGQVGFMQFNGTPYPLPSPDRLKQLMSVLNGMQEVDLLFEEARIYLRKADHGYVVIFLESFAAIAMIRLQCEVLIPSLNSEKPKGLMRLFKRS
jgi:hypothetical protein